MFTATLLLLAHWGLYEKGEITGWHFTSHFLRKMERDKSRLHLLCVLVNGEHNCAKLDKEFCQTIAGTGRNKLETDTPEAFKYSGA